MVLHDFKFAARVTNQPSAIGSVLRAMLESVCEHPLPRRHLNETDLPLSEQQKAYLRAL
jgi:hypothetical protein